MSEREIILSVEGEGGDITLRGARTKDGWRFQRNVVDQTLVMIDEGDEIRHDSQFTSSWHEALDLMDRYPWQRLYPLQVNPEFGHAVWAAVQKRCDGECSEHALKRWRDRCGVGV